MADIRITQSALQMLRALDDADSRAVDAALAVIDEQPGQPINLPGAPAGTSYLALPARRNPGGPVIIYRPLLPMEGEGWLVVSVLSHEEYRDIGRAEELMASSPAAREIVSAIVAGTAATSTVSATPGMTEVTPKTGGAVPTAGSDKP
jgi:PHD/YefM family antitoxin component YafN of YafNO toxin-antitoxin module